MDNMMLGARDQRGENLLNCDVPRHLGQAGARVEEQGQGAARAVQAAGEEGRLRRQPLGRSAQAARDGPGADERPEDDHARRADGRREPRADPVAAGPHPEPARRGHDRALRRARHARRPPHLRLGRGDGRGPDRRRRLRRHRDVRPGRDRRLPRRPPRHRPGRRRAAQRRGPGGDRRRGGRRGGRARGESRADRPTTMPARRRRSDRDHREPQTAVVEAKDVVAGYICRASTSSTAAAWSPTPAR